MKTTALNRSLQALAACALLGVAGSSWAASTWNLEANCGAVNTPTTGAVSCGNSDIGGISVTAQAYSTTTGTTTTPILGTTFSGSRLDNYGAGYGVGVVNTSEVVNVAPDHAMDNNAGTELIALKFGAAVNLSNITLGYWNTDADITVLAYTGTAACTVAQATAGTCTPTISGKAATDFTAANGWASVKNYGANGASVHPASDSADLSYTTTDSTTYSSWWLISAYNVGFGGGTLDTIADYVKLMSVAGSTKTSNGTPEPGSLALLGMGLLGMLGTARRRKGSAAK